MTDELMTNIVRKTPEQEYYEWVVAQPEVENIMVLEGEDAIKFIKGLGKLEQSPYETGLELMNMVTKYRQNNGVTLIMPHDNIVFLVAALEQSIDVFISTEPANIRKLAEAGPDTALKQQTLSTLDAIVQERKDERSNASFEENEMF
jgi:hypothetical protein